MWLQKFRRAPTTLASLLFWDSIEHMPDGVMQQKDGSFLATVRYRGPDLESAMDEELVIFCARMNNILKRFGGGWSLLSEARRSPVATYPDAEAWPDPVSGLVDAERRQFFETPGRFFETTTYVTLWQAKPTRHTSRWRKLLYANLPEPDAERHRAARFLEECQRTTDMLKDCCPEAELLNHADLLTYLQSTVSPFPPYQRVQVPQVGSYLDTYLTQTDVSTGLYPCFGDSRYPATFGGWIRCISPSARRGQNPYPRQSWPGMFATLQDLPVAYRACLRYLPLDPLKAAQVMHQYAQSWAGQQKTAGQLLTEKRGKRVSTVVNKVAMEYQDEASEAQAAVQRGDVSEGYLTGTVVVWDTDIAEADRKAGLVELAFRQAGCVVKVEDLNTFDAWLGTIPGDSYHNVRMPLLDSGNLAHMLPSMARWRGVQANAHLQGPALMQVVGRGQTQIGLDTYAGDVGHTVVAGPTGSGKSTCVALMALQFLRYTDAQVYIFEMGHSFRCATYGVGGQWYEVGEELTRTFRSGGHLDDSDFHPWASAWMPPSGGWQCFELTELMKTPTMVARVVQSLFDAIEARLTGVPTMLIFDEAWKYVRPLSGVDTNAAAFMERIEDRLRTLRKLNGMVVFSTQSLADMANSPLNAVIAESCMTRLFLANGRVLEPKIAKLYDGYGLSARQRQLIAQLVPKKEYYYSTVGGGQAVVDLAMGPRTLAFTGASSREDVRQMEALYDKDPAHFASNWLAARGQGGINEMHARAGV